MRGSLIVQLGFVVPDLRAAAAEWTSRYGVGPFFYMLHLPMEGYRYRDSDSRPDVSTALADWNGVQIQLVEQHDDQPSPHRDFLRARGPGLNHIAVRVPDFAAEVSRRKALGDEPVVSVASGTNVFYHWGDWTFPALEMSDRDATDYVERLYRVVAEGARDWDGTDPWRPMPPL